MPEVDWFKISEHRYTHVAPSPRNIKKKKEEKKKKKKKNINQHGNCINWTAVHMRNI
jgi:hypothetical protein